MRFEPNQLPRSAVNTFLLWVKHGPFADHSVREARGTCWHPILSCPDPQAWATLIVALVAATATTALCGTFLIWGAACVTLLLTCTFCAVGTFWLVCTALFASALLGLMSTITACVFVVQRVARLAASVTVAVANTSAGSAPRYALLPGTGAATSFCKSL